METRGYYNSVCSAMDVIEDTLQALHAWTISAATEEDGKAAKRGCLEIALAHLKLHVIPVPARAPFCASSMATGDPS